VALRAPALAGEQALAVREIGRALAASGGDQREGGAENGRRMERTRYALPRSIPFHTERAFLPVPSPLPLCARCGGARHGSELKLAGTATRSHANARDR
jgi:hypothetical protein